MITVKKIKYRKNRKGILQYVLETTYWFVSFLSESISYSFFVYYVVLFSVDFISHTENRIFICPRGMKQKF